MHSQLAAAAITLVAILGTTAGTPTRVPDEPGAEPDRSQVVARNLPDDGKVRFFVGPDSSTLAAYRDEVVDTHDGAPDPGGIALNTWLVLGAEPEPLAGLYGPSDYGSGVVDFPASLRQYPGTSLSVGLQLSDAGDGCGNVPLRAIAGTGDPDVAALTVRYRGRVDELIDWLQRTGRQVFLRIGPEFDGPWHCYQPEPYTAAFRYIKQRIDALSATRVATVWQSSAWPFNEPVNQQVSTVATTDTSALTRWYPGDAAVDWIAVSGLYGRNYRDVQFACQPYPVSPRDLQERVLAFARTVEKPVMIADAAPQGFAVGTRTASCLFANEPKPLTAEDIWQGWYADLFDFVADNTDVIRAVTYLNAHWDQQPTWACSATPGEPGCASGYWGDSRVQADPLILDRYLAELNKPIYLRHELPPTLEPEPVPAGQRDGFAQIEAETFDAAQGVQTIDAGSASQIGEVNRGDWFRFDRMWFGTTSPNQLSLRYSSGLGLHETFTLQVRAGSATGPILAEAQLTGTGGWRSYRRIQLPVNALPEDGASSIAIVFAAEDDRYLADVDWLSFAR